MRRTLASTSLNFDLAVYECFVPLSVGGTVQVRGNALQVERTDELTLINTVPSAMSGLLERGEVPRSTRVIESGRGGARTDPGGADFCAEPGGTGVQPVRPLGNDDVLDWLSMSRENGFNGSIGRPIATRRSIYWIEPGSRFR